MIQIFTHLRTFDEQVRWGGRTPGKLGCNSPLSTYSHFAMIAGERSVHHVYANTVFRTRTTAEGH